MDQLLRGTIYVAIGLLLLFCNIYYVRSLLTLREQRYMIAPISVIGGSSEQEAGAATSQGLGLAQLLQARIQLIEREIVDANESLTRTSRIVPRPQTSPFGAFASGPARFVALFDSVRIPTEILSTPDIKIAVSGVEVGGLFSWLQSKLIQRPGLYYAIYLSPGNERKLASANLSAISNNAKASQWFESDEAIGDLISNLAYATVQARLAQIQGSRVGALSLEEFRSLLRSMTMVSALNQRIDSGFLPEAEDYRAVASVLEPIVTKASTWPELRYMMAVIAERAQEYDRAAKLYRSVQSSRGTAGPALLSAISAGEVAACIERVDRLRSPNGMFRDHKLDPVRARKVFQAALDEVWPEYEKAFGFTLPRPTVTIMPEVNAFWSPAGNEILVGAMWENSPDIIYYEAAHPFLVRYIPLELLGAEASEVDAEEATGDSPKGLKAGQSTDSQFPEAMAVEQSYAAALTSWYLQKRAGQTAAQADWILALGGAAWINDDRTLQGFPLRSLREPGSAHPHDPQVSDYQFVRQGTVREPVAASGVGARAFYEVAMSSDTETAMRLWLNALPRLDRSISFPSLASATIAAAEAGKNPSLVRSVRQAWSVVNVQP